MILLLENVNRIVNNQKEGNSLMVNRRRDKDYIRKVIRISQKYTVLCDFLDFYAGYKEINKFEFYNNIFNYSLSKISSDVGYKFKIFLSILSVIKIYNISSVKFPRDR